MKKENLLLRSVIEQLKGEMTRRKQAHDEELGALQQQVQALEGQLAADVSPILHVGEDYTDGYGAVDTYLPTDMSDPLDIAVANVALVFCSSVRPAVCSHDGAHAVVELAALPGAGQHAAPGSWHLPV